MLQQNAQNAYYQAAYVQPQQVRSYIYIQIVAGLLKP